MENKNNYLDNVPVAELNKVNEICESYGYGNVMAIASELWKKHMEDSALPVTGVFVPALPSNVSDAKGDLQFINEIIEDLDKYGYRIGGKGICMLKDWKNELKLKLEQNKEE